MINIIILSRKTTIKKIKTLKCVINTPPASEYKIYLIQNDQKLLKSDRNWKEFNQNGINILIKKNMANQKISTIYNTTIELIKESSTLDDIVLFFDDDTEFEKEFFENINDFINQNYADLCVPIIKHNENIVSPLHKYLDIFPKKINNKKLINSKNIYFINSGMAFKCRYFNKIKFLVDERLSFYGTDTYIAKNYQINCEKIYINQAHTKHSLYMLENTDYFKNRQRFNQIIESFNVIYGESLKTSIRKLICAFKYSFRYKSIYPIFDFFKK